MPFMLIKSDVSNRDSIGNFETFDSTDIAGISKKELTPDTWNSADKGSLINVTNGDLTIDQQSGTWQSIRSVKGNSTGKYYMEHTCTDIHSSGFCILGVATSVPLMSSYFSIHIEGHGYYAADGLAYNNNSGQSFSVTYTDTDVIMVGVDLENQALYMGKNGVWGNGEDPTSGPSRTGVPTKHYLVSGKTYYICAAIYGVTNNVTSNYGNSAFSHTVPVGYTEGWG